MDISEARGLAAQAWCKETTSGRVMDVKLAEEFAKILMDEVNKARREVHGWEETACIYSDGCEYYHGLVQKIGLMLGEDAYIADDGSRQEDVLCAKVPELVEQLIRSRSLPRGGFF